MSEADASNRMPDYRKVVIKRSDPTRYDWSDSIIHEDDGKFNHPEVKIDTANVYTSSLIKLLLSYIIKTREPRTIEFIDHPRWKRPADKVKRLRGVILRDAQGNVLLYAQGFGLDSVSGNLTQIFFDGFNIHPEDQLRTKNITWLEHDYSVIIDLNPQEQ